MAEPTLPNQLNKNIFGLTGRRFGRLTVTGYADSYKGRRRWNCVCDCGIELLIPTKYLTNGDTKSCGCLRKEITRNRMLKHGMSLSPEFWVWAGMNKRCSNENTGYYHNYGGRGIEVCERWRDSFENFFADMGKRPTPKHTLERKDNSEGYNPDNCKWATSREQANNTRRNHLITFNNRTQSIAGWASELGLKPHTLLSRLMRGWPLEKALTLDKQHGKKLSLEDVADIRALIAQGKTHKEIAIKFGVTPSMISTIRTGHTWR